MTVIYRKNKKLLNKSNNLLIPKKFHRIWLGGKPMPDEFIRFRETWIEKHPDWEMKLWTEENMIPLQNQREYDNATKLAQKADIARIEIIHKFGGIYIDCDFECLKNIEPLLKGVEAFTVYEEPGIINLAIIGCVPGHPVYKLLIDNLPKSIRENKHLPINHQTGPHYHSRMLKSRKDITIFPPKLFYPYLYTEMHRKNKDFPSAYAVHHWEGSWR